MSKVIVPTIGRQVWFWGFSRVVAGRPDDQPEAATVCYVHSPSMVNLQVINCNGEARSVCSVFLRQPDTEPPTNDAYCEWMPYQIGQAAKHDTPKSAANEGYDANGSQVTYQDLSRELTKQAASESLGG